MPERRPQLVVIAGPNGAGKSTTAPTLLVGKLKVDEFVNADTIARGLSAFHPEQTAIEAGRIMLRRLHQLADQRAHFAFESTLASKSFAPWISNLQKSGYAFHLLFLWLPSPELAIARVLDRVRLGGHNIPEETVRRRYQRGLENFFNLYQPMTEFWQFYDNSGPSGPSLLAGGKAKIVETLADAVTWARITR